MGFAQRSVRIAALLAGAAALCASGCKPQPSAAVDPGAPAASAVSARNAPKGPAACAEASVSLTGENGESWRADATLAFDGRFAVVVCAADRRRLDDVTLAHLHAALTDIVEERNFTMAGICGKPSEPAARARLDALYAEPRQEVLRRLDAVAGGVGLIRGFDCAFGWTHYDEGGAALSGS